jgi:hypothetical protein
MTAPRPTEIADDDIKNWPFLQHVVLPIAAWWRKHAETSENAAELGGLGCDELARVASDVGVSASDLCALSQHCSDAAELLERRIAALDMDPKVLARDAGAQLRDMERLCTMCESKGRCARDLAADPDDEIWRKYCPNQEALIDLSRAGLK